MRRDFLPFGDGRTDSLLTQLGRGEGPSDLGAGRRLSPRPVTAAAAAAAVLPPLQSVVKVQCCGSAVELACSPRAALCSPLDSTAALERRCSHTPLSVHVRATEVEAGAKYADCHV